jgi:hypothetical protein
VQLPPGNPNHAPPIGEQQPVALPIVLESPIRVVHPSPIQLDDQPLLRPKAVGHEESPGDGDVGIQPRTRQIGPLKRRDE